MLKLKYWIKDFFGFPRSQVNGFLILIIVVTGFLFSQPLWHWWKSSRPQDRSADKAILDSLVASWAAAKNKELPGKGSATIAKPFNFDPNNTTTEQLTNLGFTMQTAERIVRYREKGGKFRIKSDLLRIYGIDSAFFESLKPFITLPGSLQPRLRAFKKFPAREVISARTIKPKFDLNKADTSELKGIYGVGEKLSLRIIKYRDALGGFLTVEQLGEVYGLDSLVIQRFAERSFVDREFRPIKININKASESQLSSHPYLRKSTAAIVSYRFQHGDFKSVEDIRKVGTLDEKTFQKIAPYLEAYDDSK